VISIQVIEPETISEITQTSNSIVVGWFMDAISNFERCYFMLADYHALFFVDPYITNLLSLKTGKPVHYLPICCDPAIHAPVPLSSEDQEEYSCDLTIAGNLYPYRVAMLDQFQDYDLKIWGRRHRWLHHPLNEKHTNRPVFGLEKSKAMRAAKIVLNTVHYANIQGINKRTFEVAGCGAFQLSDAPGLPDAFRPDVEIATFSSKQDLKDKVDYYLGHPGERAEMAERAQKRAHGEHTYAHRWHRMVEILAHEGIAVPFPDRDVNAVVA
jgi:spore maturation protein CgeB